MQATFRVYPLKEGPPQGKNGSEPRSVYRRTAVGRAAENEDDEPFNPPNFGAAQVIDRLLIGEGKGCSLLSDARSGRSR